MTNRTLSETVQVVVGTNAQRDLPILLVVGFALASYYAFTQPVMTLENGLFEDAVHYHRMILQAAAKEQLSADGPFVYRVGLPMLVGWTLRTFGGEPQSVIQIYHFVFGLLGYFVFLLIVLRLVPSRTIVYVLALMFMTNYNVPFRLGGIYPYYVDSPAMFVSLLILYLNLVWRELTLGRLALLCLLAVLGVFFREYVLAALLASMFAHHVKLSQCRPWIIVDAYSKFIIGLLPFVFGLLTLLAIRSSVNPTGEHSFTGQASWSLIYNITHPHKLLLDALMCYGPLFLVFLFVSRKAWQKVIDHPMLLAFGLTILALALIGGTHTPRFFYWGAPAILPFLGWVLMNAPSWPERHGKLLLGILLALQLVASRAILPVPDIDSMNSSNLPNVLVLAPYGEKAHYWHLWPIKMSPTTKAILLAQYGLIAIALLFIRFWPRKLRKEAG